MSPARTRTPETDRVVRALVRAIEDANREGDRARAALLAARLARLSRALGLGLTIRFT